MNNKTGKVWLVGAGPGDAGLITVKGLKVLQKAQVVVYDKLVGIELLNCIPAQAQKIDVGKRADNHPVPQEEINRILLREALAGKEVVRLKGGDPFLFGRGGEELELLVKHHIPYEIVPGIPSALSVPAYAGIPVTHRDFCSAVHIITGHQKNGETLKINFDALAGLDGTLVFLMGVTALQSICQGLLQAGMPPQTPAAIIEKGATARQRKIISTLAGLYPEAVEQGIQAPSVIVVGQVCALGETLGWAEQRPLHGIRVIVTRPEKLSSVLSEHIRSLGGEAIELPCINQPDNEFTRSLVERYDFDYTAFTSASTVKSFVAAFPGLDPSQIKAVCIGEQTAKEAGKYGMKVHISPQATIDGMTEALVSLNR